MLKRLAVPLAVAAGLFALAVPLAVLQPVDASRFDPVTDAQIVAARSSCQGAGAVGSTLQVTATNTLGCAASSPGTGALRYDTGQSLTAAQQAQARTNAGLNGVGAVAFRNRIVNGNLAINQRGAATASTAYAAAAYTVDRWKAGTNGATLSLSAAASGDVTASITAGTLLQVIEGALYLPEGGAYVAAWTGTATCRAYQGTATGSYVASPLAVTGWTAGTNGTLECQGGTLGLVQFEPGTVATVFERRDDELRRCQRYYETSYPGFAKPGTAVRAGVIGLFVGGSNMTGGGIYTRFSVRKRATPAVNVYSTADGAVGQFFDVVSGTNRAANLDLQSEYGFRAYNNSLGPQAAVALETQYTAEAEL